MNEIEQIFVIVCVVGFFGLGVMLENYLMKNKKSFLPTSGDKGN